LGVQSVRLFYMTMFAPEHIEMSCFFDQERADRAIRAARTLAEELRWRDPARAFEFELPPLFSEPAAPAPSRCSDPWQYLYVELMGAVQPCCQWGKHIGNLHQDSVDGLWNGEVYRSLRKGMAGGDPHPWCRSCTRYTGYNVCNILSHVTNRPNEQRALLAEIEARGLLKNPSAETKRLLSPVSALRGAA
ncbi:MAG TPA: SPASM domain-containing protein, partial [Elusimicrobiota bacterium]|nr:SPASM domain-containing protein [Elusimicrobiota bacterium]